MSDCVYTLRKAELLMFNSLDDTITAISTAQVPAGIGIVRISGTDAVNIADKLYHGKNGKVLSEQKGNTVHYGMIVKDGKPLDEVLVMLLRAPHSYTGEDTVEIDCHGGILAVNRVLEAVLDSGARLAEPGEFTKRAYLNGRIDLSQAEAVMDLISAKSEYALESSLSQLKGSLHNAITDIRDELLSRLAFIESALDDPEHYSLDGYGGELSPVIADLKKKITGLIETSVQGKYIEEGISTVILGKPNAGKSSLLNMMTGIDRAIVTDIPGTTRDVLKETIQLGGVALKLVDTAGIRRSDDIVEQIGVNMAKDEAAGADLILYVVDTSSMLDENDLEILSMVEGKKVIVLLNKSDLSDKKIKREDLEKICSHEIIETSALSGRGIERLKEKIKEMFFSGGLSFNDEVYITNVRHKKALEEAKVSLENVEEALRDGIPEDVYSIDIFGAIMTLDTIIGGDVSEDLVNTIFEKFCMGK